MPNQVFEKHVWAEIDLDALRQNFRAVKQRAGELPLCAVVKADVYKRQISASTMARTAALALALTNQLLSCTGHSVLPIESEQLEQLVRCV